MQTIPQPRPGDPVPLHQALAGLLALSDERDSWMRQLLAAGRDSYRRGLADGIALGRRLEAAERDAEWKATARTVARIDPGFMSRRWAVRGEPRTRATFGQPHPDDFTGRGAA